MNRELAQLDRKRWRRSWRWSLLFHSSVFVALILQLLWLPQLGVSATGALQPQAEIEIQYDESVEGVARTDDRPWLERDSEDSSLTDVDLNDLRWQDVLSEPLRHESGVATDAGASSLISDQLMRSIAASGRNSTAENLENLDDLTRRLNSVSSSEGVDEVSGTIGRLIGAEGRETKPKEGVAGKFDHNSAEPHECRKEVQPNGKVKYIVVMVDAAGRTQEAEMDDVQGEKLFRTMEFMKENPLLEKIYRGVVMNLMDQMLKEQPRR